MVLGLVFFGTLCFNFFIEPLPCIGHDELERVTVTHAMHAGSGSSRLGRIISFYFTLVLFYFTLVLFYFTLVLFYFIFISIDFTFTLF